ncbi:MAG: hypothetical protein QF886_12845, partial [Planctomycetota bacterium]|nr:hypothetical protein [Planctomycetota bacterium]
MPALRRRAWTSQSGRAPELGHPVPEKLTNRNTNVFATHAKTVDEELVRTVRSPFSHVLPQRLEMEFHSIVSDTCSIGGSTTDVRLVSGHHPRATCQVKMLVVPSQKKGRGPGK